MSAIKELYYGNIGNYEHLTSSREWKRASDNEYKQNNKLETLLTDEQRKEFDLFKELIMERNAIEVEDAYEYALGIGIAIGYESRKNI